MASGLKEIGNSVYLYTGVVNDECRIKIKKLQPDNDGKMIPVDYKGISLTIEQWCALVKVKNEISSELKKKRQVRTEEKSSWRLSTNRFVSVSRLKSKYIPGDFYFTLVDIRVYFMGNTEKPENPTRYGISLNEEQWEKVMSFMPAIEKELGLKSDSMHTKVMIECIASSLLHHIEEIAKTKCIGCSTDHPSQKHHMDGGCLTATEEKIDIYYDEAKERLDRLSVLGSVVKIIEDDTYDVWNLYGNVIVDNESDIRNILKLPSDQWEYVLNV